jgi:outer membrane protein
MTFRSIALSVVGALALNSAAARAEQKFAYVDLQRAISEVDEGRQAKARLQQILDAKQKDLDREQEALRKEKEQLDKQASAMSEEARVQKQGDLQKKLFELAQKFEKGKQEIAMKEQTEMQAIIGKMDPILTKIAQREGFTMVFDRPGLVYAPGHLDLTNELVRMYNDQHKAKATASADAPAKKEASPKKDSSAATKAQAPKK